MGGTTGRINVIRMNDFRAEPAALLAEQSRAFERVQRSGWYILGPEVAQFEKQWAERCQVPAAAGVANGLDAIELGLRALAIGPGDEVITTPMTAFATVLGIMRAGATPVLADIDPQTGLLSPLSVRHCISRRTRAVLLVHLYGHVHRMDQWLHFCQTEKLDLLEDCAQAHLSSWQGRSAGSFGRWGAYSFYPTKNLGALGDAGALVSTDAALIEHVKVLRNYGQSERYHHPFLGANSRLDELQAALLSVRLAWLEEFTSRRRSIARRYIQGIKNPLLSLLAAPDAEEEHCYHLFVVLTPQREALRLHLQKHEIESLSHYPVPIHRQQAVPDIMEDPEGLHAAERHAEQCLSIPCHPYLGDNEVDRIIETLNNFQGN